MSNRNEEKGFGSVPNRQPIRNGMARSNSQAGNNSSLQKIGANVLGSHSKLSGAFGS